MSIPLFRRRLKQIAETQRAHRTREQQEALPPTVIFSIPVRQGEQPSERRDGHILFRLYAPGQEHYERASFDLPAIGEAYRGY